MTIRTKLVTIIAAVLMTSIAGLSGCATTGMQRSEKTSTRMKVLESDIQQAIAQINLTGASLDELVRPGQSDVKKAFEKYSDNVDKMDSQGKQLLGHADKMSAQGKEYFEEWQKQGNTYNNSDIQGLSEQRRSDLSSVYVKITEASVGLKGNFKAYLSDINGIKKYLSNDLTPKGVESITPVAQKAVRDGESLKFASQPLLDAIGNARSELAQGGTK